MTREVHAGVTVQTPVFWAATAYTVQQLHGSRGTSSYHLQGKRYSNHKIQNGDTVQKTKI